MYAFDNEISKIVAKSLLKKIDIEKVVDKAIPQIEQAIEKDLVFLFKDGALMDALSESDMVYDIADGLSGEVIKRLGLAVKSKKKR